MLVEVGESVRPSAWVAIKELRLRGRQWGEYSGSDTNDYVDPRLAGGPSISASDSTSASTGSSTSSSHSISNSSLGRALPPAGRWLGRVCA